MFQPDPTGVPPTADADAASSLAEDSVHEADKGEEALDTNVFETQSVHEVTEAPVDVTALQLAIIPGGGGTHGGGAQPSTYAGQRLVQAPYSQREDVRGFGIYIGNWSGRRKQQIVNDHIAADLIVRNPAQVLLAQEVDERFIEALRHPAESQEAQTAPHAVVGQGTPAVAGQGRNYNDRPVNMREWHVAAGTEGTGSAATSLIVAARSTRAKSSTVVEWNKLFHREYKKGGRTHFAYSRVLTAQVEWHEAMHGRMATQVANVHFHHLAAKKEHRVVVREDSRSTKKNNRSKRHEKNKKVNNNTEMK